MVAIATHNRRIAKEQKACVLSLDARRLCAPLGFKGNDTNLYRYVGNAPTQFTDPSGLEKDGFLDYDDIKKLHDESQQLVDDIRKNNPKDPRLLFLDTQQSILAELANADARKMTAQEVDWMARVLKRFMDSLNNALQGKIAPQVGATNPKTGKLYTTDELNQGMQDYFAGKVGGPWWGAAMAGIAGSRPLTTANDKYRFGLNPDPQEAAAVILAWAHIYYDLMMALYLEGAGNDETWKYIGEAVARASKKHGRFMTNLMQGVMPRMGNTKEIDPLLMREKMRDKVKDYLQSQGIKDPFKGIDPCDIKVIDPAKK
jgi:hypothetical protein